MSFLLSRSDFSICIEMFNMPYIQDRTQLRKLHGLLLHWGTEQSKKECYKGRIILSIQRTCVSHLFVSESSLRISNLLVIMNTFNGLKDFWVHYLPPFVISWKIKHFYSKQSCLEFAKPANLNFFPISSSLPIPTIVSPCTHTSIDSNNHLFLNIQWTSSPVPSHRLRALRFPTHSRRRLWTPP